MCHNEACVGRHLAGYYQSLERSTGGSFPRMEAEIDRRMNAARFGGRTNRTADGSLDRDEVDFVIQNSGASTPGLFSGYDTIRNRVWSALDINRDSRVSSEELRTLVERYRTTPRASKLSSATRRSR